MSHFQDYQTKFWDQFIIKLTQRCFHSG